MREALGKCYSAGVVIISLILIEGQKYANPI
jgi:hypothetical protein